MIHGTAFRLMKMMKMMKMMMSNFERFIKKNLALEKRIATIYDSVLYRVFIGTLDSFTFKHQTK